MDLWFHLPTGLHWPHHCCEPLVIGLAFPLRRQEPWKVRQLPAVVELERTLQAMFKDGDLGQGSYLRELWIDPWRLR